MFIVTYLSRAKSPDDARTVCTMFLHDYSLRVRPGFIRGDCAINVDAPCVVLAVIYWGTEAARDALEASEEAQRSTATFTSYLVAPPEISVYEVS